MILGNNFLRLSAQNALFSGLTYQPKRNLYIHLLDHLKKINPEKTKLNIAHLDPKYIKDDVPVQPLISIKLKNRFQKSVDRKLFEDYKIKVLTGTVHQEQQKQIDELWGQNEVPTHYYHYFTLAQLMKVSHPQKNQVSQYIKELALNKLYKFNSDVLSKYDKNDQDAIISAIPSMSIKQLADFSFALANKNDSNLIHNKTLWFSIDKILQKKAYLLTTSELIRTKQAFIKIKKIYGSPNLNSILRDLIQEDMNNNKLSFQQLLGFLYTLRIQSNGKLQLVQKVIQNILEKVTENTTLQDRINILLVYCDGRKPISSRPIHKKYLNEDVARNIRLFHGLNLHNLVCSQDLNEQLISKLLYCLTTLKISRCRNVMDQVDKYCKKNQDKLSAKFIYTVLSNLNEVEDKKGHYNEELFKMLYQKMEANWSQYSTIEKIKMIHALWTVRLWDQKLQNLYKQTQMQPQSSVLHYFAEIQRHHTSGRQWQILHYLVQLDYIPLPYFQNFTRYVNYIKSITNWNLKPIQDKLKNTQCHFDIVRHQKKHMFTKDFYPKLKKFLEFASAKGSKLQLIFPLNPGYFIDNVEFVMFAFPEYQISFDIVNDQECLQGKQLLKKTYYSKMESLYSLGWRHYALHERQLNNFSILKQIIISINQAQEYIQEQKTRIEQYKQVRSHQITRMRNENRWTFMTGQQVENWTNDPQQAMKIQAEKQEMQKKLQQILLKTTPK